MSLIRTLTVLVKLPGNKSEKLVENIPADWVTGEKDALSEVLENPKIRTRVSVVPDYIISAQISQPWDPSNAGRIIRG